MAMIVLDRQHIGKPNKVDDLGACESAKYGLLIVHHSHSVCFFFVVIPINMWKFPTKIHQVFIHFCELW